LGFWTSKRNLMELVAFSPSRPPAHEDQQKYGLQALDIDRFLQVSPLVKGRENIGTSADEVAEHANIQSIPRESSESDFGESEYESTGTSGPLESPEREITFGETASNSRSSAIPEGSHFEVSSPKLDHPSPKAGTGSKSEPTRQRITTSKKRSDFDTPA